MAAIDCILVYLLKDQPGFNVYFARLVSYSAALTVGYFLNRDFTFYHVDNDRSLPSEMVRFFSVHATGGVLNIGIFAVVAYFGARANLARSWDEAVPLIGICIGGMAGMCFNFVFSRQLVFED